MQHFPTDFELPDVVKESRGADVFGMRWWLKRIASAIPRRVNPTPDAK